MIHKFDLEKRKLDKALENITAFDVSANGEKMLYRQGFGPMGGWCIAPTLVPLKPGEGRLKTDEIEVQVDPTAECAQM